MIKGIRYQEGMEAEGLKKEGFELLEYQYERDLAEEEHRGEKSPDDGHARKGNWGGKTGMVISASLLIKERFSRVHNRASLLGASYLVIETVDIEDGTALIEMLETYTDDIMASGIKIFIENGYCSKGFQILENAFSGISELKDFTDRLNQKVQGGIFGICLNTGRANVLGRNLCGMVEALGNRICLIHINDNDGRRDMRQLPYTFTKGRGQLTTDWYGLIGALAKARYGGPVVYDIAGLFDISPRALLPAWCGLLAAIAREWEMILDLEEYLKKTGRLILFGAGNMFKNYMEVWGDVYPPDFIIDNNKSLWGETRLGIAIRSPRTLLKYTQENPVVLICNIYYESIERQLKAMGVVSRRYDDKYFFRYQRLFLN